MEWLHAQSSAWFGPTWGPAVSVTLWSLAAIVAIVAPLMGAVAYLTLWERKMIGWMQIRLGPNRVGPFGLLQPIADGVKLLMKEIILPGNANKALFLLALWRVCCWMAGRGRAVAVAVVRRVEAEHLAAAGEVGDHDDLIDYLLRALDQHEVVGFQIERLDDIERVAEVDAHGQLTGIFQPAVDRQLLVVGHVADAGDAVAADGFERVALPSRLTGSPPSPSAN